MIAVGIARWLLVLVLGVAAVAKVVRFPLFAQTFALLPFGGSVLAAGLIGFEATAAVLLASGRELLLGAALAVALASGFSGLTIISLRRPEPLACVCFGSRSDQLGVSALVRNVLLLVVAGVVLGAAESGAAGESASLMATTGSVLAAWLLISMYRVAVDVGQARWLVPWRVR